MGPTSPQKAYELLQTQHKLADLIAITREVLQRVARERKSEWADAEKVKPKVEELKLERDDAKTELGNALDILERGPDDAAGRALAKALYARVLADAPPSDAESAEQIATDLLWLSAHTPFDATDLIDPALGDRASELWVAIAERVRRIDARKLPNERPEALMGCAALCASTSKAARKQLGALGGELEDEVLKRIVRSVPEEARVSAVPPAFPEAKAEEKSVEAKAEAAPAEAKNEKPETLEDEGEAEKLSGELLPSPRGPVATAALALTGLLFLVHALRLVARLALAYRRPTEVTLDAKGVRVRAKTVMLGRTLRDSETLISRTGLVRATREVRYPRLAFYAGLLALAVGSYLGVRTLVDGARSASPSLLLAGLVIVAIGIALDFALTSLGPGTTGRCRLLFVPRTGPALCVGSVDMKRADAALTRLRKNA